MEFETSIDDMGNCRASIWSLLCKSGWVALTVSVGVGVKSIGRAFKRALFRLIRCGLFAKRDMIPARVGLRFVVVVDESLENKTLLHDSLSVVVGFSLRFGLDVGDIGGFRRMIFSLEFECEGLDVIGEISSSDVF